MTVKCRMSPYLASEKNDHRFLRKTQPDNGYGSAWGAGFPAIFCSSLPFLRFSETHDYESTSFPYFTMRTLELTNSPAIPSERISWYRVFFISSPLEIVHLKRFMARKIEVKPNDASDGTSHIPMDSLKAITTSLRRLKNRRRNTWFREIEEQVFSQLDKTKNQQMYCQHPNGNQSGNHSIFW